MVVRLFEIMKDTLSRGEDVLISRIACTEAPFFSLCRIFLYRLEKYFFRKRG